jgi:hypothetical protein
MWLERLQRWLGIEPDDAWLPAPLPAHVQPAFVRSAAYEADLAELRTIVATLRDGVEI